MPANKSRKYQRVVSYIEDVVGADVNRDMLKVALAADDVNGLTTDLTEISGQVQSAVDVADQIDKIQNILSSQTITVTDDGSLAVASLPEPLDVSASEVGVDITTQTASPLTVTDDGNLAIAAWNAGTLTITDNGAFNVAGTVAVQENNPLDVSATTVPVEIATTSNTKSTTQLAAGVDISGGVSHQIDKKDYSIYAVNTGASSADVALSYSPDGGGTYIDDPDGSVSVASGDGTIFAIDYDATHVQVTASNTEPFNVWVVEQ